MRTCPAASFLCVFSGRVHFYIIYGKSRCVFSEVVYAKLGSQGDSLPNELGSKNLL